MPNFSEGVTETVPSPIHEKLSETPGAKTLPGAWPTPSSLRCETWLLPEPLGPISRCSAPRCVPGGTVPGAGPKETCRRMSASCAGLPAAVASGSSVSTGLTRLVPATWEPVPSARVSSEYQPLWASCRTSVWACALAARPRTSASVVRARCRSLAVMITSDQEGKSGGREELRTEAGAREETAAPGSGAHACERARGSVCACPWECAMRVACLGAARELAARAELPGRDAHMSVHVLRRHATASSPWRAVGMGPSAWLHGVDRRARAQRSRASSASNANPLRQGSLVKRPRWLPLARGRPPSAFSTSAPRCA